MNIFKRRKKMKISIYGEQVLRQRAAEIEGIDDEVKELASSMITCMRDNDGVGLAAPQVGISRRLVVLGLPQPKNPVVSPGEILLYPKMPLVLINPQLSPIGDEISTAEEGCLSVPDIYASVSRPKTVMLKATLLNNEHISIECSGFLARALQHETDHLNGTLFVDLLKKSDYALIKNKLKQLKR